VTVPILHCPLPGTIHRLLRWLASLLAMVLAMAYGVAAAAQPVAGALVLQDHAGRVDAWAAVRMLEDPAAVLAPADALARLDQFTVPRGPHANPGPHRGALWLYLALYVPPGQSGARILEIDYAGLQRVDIAQVAGGRLAPAVALGTTVPRRLWPLPSRAPALALALEPGQLHGVLMRIESAGGVVVPVWLSTPGAYKLHEERVQAFQGLLAGLGLFLLLYSLIQWSALRDTLFLDYALINIGLIVVSQVLFGVGPQHLWPGSEWLARNGAPAAVLLGSVGSFRFVGRWLAGMGAGRRMLLALRAGAVFTGLALACLAAGWIDYRLAVVLGSAVAPLPMLAALPFVFRHARAGDRSARYMLLGWACFGAGAAVLALLVHGVLPAHPWTQHAFQVCSLAEMTLFMVVLGMRVHDVRRAAELAQREHATLQAQVQTDPLTGLLNRRGLRTALEGALRSARPGCATAVFVIDLDGFKPINDRLGHDVGDAVLVAVAERLRAQVRAGDVVARTGGDEFVVVLSGLQSDEQAAALGAQWLRSFDMPFHVGGQACRVGLTIGYCLAPHDGRDADSLLRRADAAMYDGKHSGRHCVRRAVQAAPDGDGVHSFGDLGGIGARRTTN
jgi:diguanylate cyclase (GGDEF)-like protein